MAPAVFMAGPIQAAPGINEQMNFQGRLLTAEGATVPDGFYNVQFKIYKDGDGQSVGNTTGTPAGTLLWTESHLNANSQGIRVQNGFLSVQLGSITSLSSVDWNSDTLWLSMNVGGTGSGATPTWDDEMLPMKRLSAVPYALNSQQLGGLDWTEFLQLAPAAAQIDASTLSSLFINKTGTGNVLQLQIDGKDEFVITDDGKVGIGLSNPTEELHVAGSGHALFQADGSASRVFIDPNALDSSAVLTLETSGKDARLRISAQSGAVSPFVSFDTASGDDWSIGLDDEDSGKFKISRGVGFGTNDYFTITPTGSVGIGTTTPANTLDVEGGIDADTLNTGQGDYELYAMDQNLRIADSPTFAGITINGTAAVSTSVLTPALDAIIQQVGDIARTNLVSHTSDITGRFDPYLVPSVFTPSANTVLVAYVHVGESCGTDYPFDASNITISGGSLDWTPIDGYSASGGCGLALRAFYALVDGSPPQNMQVTVDAGSHDSNAYDVVVDEFHNLDRTTPAVGAIFDERLSSVNDTFSIDVTATPATGDWKIGASLIQNDGDPTSYDVPTGWTELHNLGTPGSPESQEIYQTGSTLRTVDFDLAGSISGFGVTVYGGFILKKETDSSAPLTIGGVNASSIAIGNSGSDITLPNVTFQADGDVTIGSVDGTGNVLVLDNKNTSGDPTGTNGAIYYNSASSTFRCFQAEVWVDCITAAGVSNVVQLAPGSAQVDGSTNSSIFINKTGASGNLLQLQKNGSDMFVVDNDGNVAIASTLTFTAASPATVQSGASQLLTIQGGDATVAGANGGSLYLSGGAGSGSGVTGSVILNTATFSTATSDANCYTGGALVAASCTISATSVNNASTIIVGFNDSGQTATLPAPTITTAGRVVYISAAIGSQDFTLEVNGGGTGNEIAMRQNTSATMIWNGTTWTAAGASSSTTLQSAYDNTLQSAGGAELVVSQNGNTNGLTIRDSLTNPVNDTLFNVQTASAAELLSVNSNVTEYTSNSGVEIAGSGGDSSFPANTWSSIGGATTSRYTAAGDFIATGTASASVATTTAAGDGIKNTLNTALTANNNYNVSFTARLTSGTFTDMSVYYSADGTAASVECTSGQAVNISIWTKVNCSFTVPASGITADNAILIRQAGSGAAHTFYLDNISVTIAADYNYASDGSVSDAANFATNWTAVSGAAVSRSTTAGNDASDSAEVITSGAGQGVRNKLAISPLSDTLYRVTVYAASTTTGFDNFTVRYSRDGGTNFVDCVDYNTRVISSSLTDFTKITCYVTTDGTATTDPYVYFTQTDGTSRTFYVDTFSMTLSSKTTPNVQIGGGINGGPVTLLTLDRGASAPIAGNNELLLGSMYYDTSLGKLQCYEADGWGACGSSPDNIVTISPEYNNAVLHGTGVGTMTSDICSDTLNINDGTSGQSTICGTNETYNFYRWTSPQATAQTYSIYLTYELPAAFEGFASGQTSIMGRTDSSSATVNYQVYRNDPDQGLIACGSPVEVSSGAVPSWQTSIASGAADPSTCGFVPGNSIVFKINMTASQNASAYVGNLNFTFSNL